MSTRSKLVYLLFVLIFAFTSLAAGAFAGVQLTAHDLDHAGTAYQANDLFDGGTSIAGHCDAMPSCSSGGG